MLRLFGWAGMLGLVAVCAWCIAGSRFSSAAGQEEPTELVVRKDLASVGYGLLHSQWQTELPPEGFQEFVSYYADDQEVVECLATVPQLLQDVLRGERAVVYRGY